MAPNGLAGLGQSKSVQIGRLLHYFETGTKAANEMLQRHCYQDTVLCDSATVQRCSWYDAVSSAMCTDVLPNDVQ